MNQLINSPCPGQYGRIVMSTGGKLKGTGSTGDSELTRRLDPCLHRGSTTRRPATGR
jgi:hypothetical protein